MKFRWRNTYKKWSIVLFCVAIFVYSVNIDSSFQEVCKESRSQSNQKDSLLLRKADILDSMRYDIAKMEDSVYVHFDMIDASIQKHINAVDSTEAVQNMVLNQIRRSWPKLEIKYTRRLLSEAYNLWKKRSIKSFIIIEKLTLE